jgi:hypothetical protein
VDRVRQGRYEIRVEGRMSDRARHAFAPMPVYDAPVETIICVRPEDGDLATVLGTIQDLGFLLVSIQEIPD